MNNPELKQIEERLTPSAAPEPPEGLLERIQKEIPGYLRLVEEAPEPPSSAWKLRLIAASVVLLVVGGALIYRVNQQAPTLEERLNEETVRSWQEIVETPPAQSKRQVPSTVDEVDELAATQAGESTSSEKPEVPAEPTAVSRDLATPGREDRNRVDTEHKRSRLDEQAQRVQKEIGAPVDSPVPAPEARQLESPPKVVEEAPAPVGVTTITSESPSLSAGAEDELRARKKRRQLPMASPMTGATRLESGTSERSREWVALPSTGGTAEPNDATYGDMFFRTYGTNPFVDTEDDPLSTFGLDVDTGSFTLARSYLDRGHLPPREAIRVEEFVNYFDYGDPAPRRGEFTLIAEGAPSPFATGARERLVRFGIKAHEVVADERDPAVLIFVVDVSGSMNRENRLGLVKRSLELLLDQLTPEDRVGLVIYGSRGEVLLDPTASQEEIRGAIERLDPGGSTNAEEGLHLAYQLARRHFREGAINRVILCSDGVANVGRTGPESILSRIRTAADEGIELTTVGFGMGNYNDALMEQLADQGDGSYAYVDTLSEARRLFVENLTGTLQTIATDAKVQVEFNPETVSRYRLLGYENRDIADERFRDDTVDAGEIGSGHDVTALYEIKLHEGVGRKQRLATMRLRYRSKAADRVVESDVDLAAKDLEPSWEQASTALRLSSVAAEFAEILKGSYWAKDSSLDALYGRLQPVAQELASEEQVQDLVYLVQRARRMASKDPGRIEE